MNPRESELNTAFYEAEDNHRVGMMMELCNQCKPNSPHELRDWYYQNVHSPQYIEELVDMVWKLVQPGYTRSEVWDYVIQKIFDRTYYGWRKQLWMVEKINQDGVKAHQVSHVVDGMYGVDIIIDATGVGIQCKAASQVGIIDVSLERKMRRYTNRTGCPCYIIHYDGEGKDTHIMTADYPLYCRIIYQALVAQGGRAS